MCYSFDLIQNTVGNVNIDRKIFIEIKKGLQVLLAHDPRFKYSSHIWKFQSLAGF